MLLLFELGSNKTHHDDAFELRIKHDAITATYDTVGIELGTERVKGYQTETDQQSHKLSTHRTSKVESTEE